MRKRIIAQSQSYASPLLEDGWLNVTDLSEVEITSEDPAQSHRVGVAAG